MATTGKNPKTASTSKAAQPAGSVARTRALVAGFDPTMQMVMHAGRLYSRNAVEVVSRLLIKHEGMAQRASRLKAMKMLGLELSDKASTEDFLAVPFTPE